MCQADEHSFIHSYSFNVEGDNATADRQRGKNGRQNYSYM